MKKLINYFKRNRTKWLPLGTYNHAGRDYITFVRKNNRTGMLHFKTKVANSNAIIGTSCYPILPTDLIDTKKAWKKITNQNTIK